MTSWALLGRGRRGRNILGRLLYVIIGAALAPIVFTIIFPPKPRISPGLQGMRIAEILAAGLKSDPRILSSPESLHKYLSNENALNKDYLTSRNILFAVLSDSEEAPSLFMMLPGGEYYVRVNQDGKAILEKIKLPEK